MVSIFDNLYSKVFIALLSAWLLYYYKFAAGACLLPAILADTKSLLTYYNSVTPTSQEFLAP